MNILVKLPNSQICTITEELPAVPYHRYSSDYWLLVAVLDGDIRLSFDDNSIELHSLQAVLLPPGIRHWEERLRPTTLARLPITVQFDPSLNNHPLFRIPTQRVMDFADLARAQTCLQTIQTMPISAKDKSRGQILEGGLLVADLLLNALSGGYASGVLNSEKSLPPQWVHQSLDILRSEYRNQDFTIDDLAHHLGKSYSKVQQRFSEHYGTSPKEWLHRYRVRQAALLLANHPNFTIEMIMKRCGYRSRSLFYSMFTRFEGKTPASFRKQS